jgi:hypothetical protein
MIYQFSLRIPINVGEDVSDLIMSVTEDGNISLTSKKVSICKVGFIDWQTCECESLLIYSCILA